MAPPAYRYGMATYQPARMSADDLTEGCLHARRAFNTYSAIGRRALDMRTHLASPYRIGAVKNAIVDTGSKSFIGSKGRDLNSDTLTAVPLLTSSSV